MIKGNPLYPAKSVTEAMSLNEDIIELLKKEGCGMVGFADLRGLPKEARQNFDFGIAILLPLSKDAMYENKNGSPQRYYDEYLEINRRLPELASMAADLLVKKGYKALPMPQSAVVSDEDFRTVLPHKTVATLAGMGWIGKCATLVTEEYGSAVRIVVVLTNAPLECGTPVTRSRCGSGCMICTDVCPGKAVRGVLWEAGVDRSVLYDPLSCRPAARARAKELLGIEETLCAQCISNCPFTKRGLGYK